MGSSIIKPCVKNYKDLKRYYCVYANMYSNYQHVSEEKDESGNWPISIFPGTITGYIKI
jgi:hypothetical protein